MTDVFERAAQAMERERQILERDAAIFGPLITPVDDIPPVPIDGAELARANEHFNPAVLAPMTRYASIKLFLLRLLSLYTRGQVEFNGSVVRVLNAWSKRLATLPAEISERLHEVQEKSNQRFVLVEQRRNVWESRFAGEMNSLRNRMSELEVELAEAQLRFEAQQVRIAQLEKRLANTPGPADSPASGSGV